jgi:hypothetical protein
MRHALALLTLCVSMFFGGLLVGCVMGIPDAAPPPPKSEACQIWVRVDDGPWHCYSRDHVLRDLKKITPPS